MKRIYIYGILDDDDNIIYVGESVTPQKRLYRHRNDYGYTRCKILDVREDMEDYWIEKLLSEGNILNNIIKGDKKYGKSGKHIKRYDVGDVISTKNPDRVGKQIRDKHTGEVYKNAQLASRSIPDCPITILSTLRLYPTSEYHKRFEVVVE